MPFDSIYGVDFSGAKLAGRNLWIAHARPQRRGPPLKLLGLNSLEQLCGTAEREPALAALVQLIKDSHNALWAVDCPFGLPIEIFAPRTRWEAQLAFLRNWTDGAYAMGVECLNRAKARGGKAHIRRLTDLQARAPFDCYHYRIIYQTFHGMRDVAAVLARHPRTAVLPFQYKKLARVTRDAGSVLLETCPGSSLKRWKLPHQNYKQPTGGPLTAVRLRTRRKIVEALSKKIQIPADLRRTLMRNAGGDALDAVIAAAGASECFNNLHHPLLARHPRYPLEGYVYA